MSSTQYQPKRQMGSSTLAPESGGGFIIYTTPQVLDPFDVSGSDMPANRHPKVSSPLYLSEDLLHARYIVIAKIMRRAEEKVDLPYNFL